MIQSPKKLRDIKRELNLPRAGGEGFPAEKAKSLESSTSSSSSTSESSLKCWKSASKSSSNPKIPDRRGLPPAENRFPELDFLRSGQRRSAVTRRDLVGGMKSEMIAPPHIFERTQKLKLVGKNLQKKVGLGFLEVNRKLRELLFFFI